MTRRHGKTAIVATVTVFGIEDSCCGVYSPPVRLIGIVTCDIWSFGQVHLFFFLLTFKQTCVICIVEACPDRINPSA